MEIGLYSFAENTPDSLSGGRLQSPAERLRDLLEEIELADQVGLDFYGLGEHHRPDFVASAPVTILAAAAAPSGGASFFIQTIPLVLIFVIFWFLMIRPQQKRMREHAAQIAAVKKGDRVVTGGGLVGKVTRVSDNEVEIDLGQNVRVTAVKSTLSQVGNPATAKPAND